MVVVMLGGGSRLDDNRIVCEIQIIHRTSRCVHYVVCVIILTKFHEATDTERLIFYTVQIQSSNTLIVLHISMT